VENSEEMEGIEQQQQPKRPSPRPPRQREEDFIMSGALGGDPDQPQDRPAEIDATAHALITALEGLAADRNRNTPSEDHDATMSAPSAPAEEENDHIRDIVNDNTSTSPEREQDAASSSNPRPMNAAAAYMRRATQKQQNLRKRKRASFGGRDSRSGTPTAAASPKVHTVHGFEIKSYHPSRLEMPTRTDFLAPYARLNAGLFKWGPPPGEDTASGGAGGTATRMMAPPPCVPDPMEGEDDEPRGSRLSSRIVEEGDGDNEFQSLQLRQTGVTRRPASINHVTLSTMPAEVRLEILRQLLVSNRPILVHKG
jgi:hypothetical protein